MPESIVLSDLQSELRRQREQNRMEDGVNVLQEIRRTAVEKINETHPHAIGPDTYVWGGVKKGWLDREEATAAGM